MQEITLQAIPNQTFSVLLDNVLFSFSIKYTAPGIICASISTDETVLIEGVRILPGEPIIPYQYLEHGNFVLLTQNDDLPDYTQFGITQSLIYATALELETIRGT